jgi:hypothetical protein
MPRVSSHRRQELRNRRRKARRSLSRLLLDDDMVIPEDDYAQLLQVEAMPRRESQGRLVEFGGGEVEDQ